VNPEIILNNLQAMGPAFLAAAAAVSIGATLLVVSIITQLRRLSLANPFRSIPSLRKGMISSSRAKTAKEKQSSFGTVRKTPSGYEPAIIVKNDTGTANQAITAQTSSEMVSRLRKAADSLEQIRQNLRQENQSQGFSELKGEAEGVEYLFKTTVG